MHYHKNAFDFEKPIIKVRVKHCKPTYGGPEIQRLLGTYSIDANTLFVSIEGFTSQAEAIM